jgi:hypothetical protein
MGDDTVSAIPGQLIGWAAWARQAAPSLERAARDLNLAIEELNLSRGDLAVLGQVPFLGDDLLAYAAGTSRPTNGLARSARPSCGSRPGGCRQGSCVPTTRTC